MIFSFMGWQHGRIVQAWYDGENLLVRKSRLIELTDTTTNPFSDACFTGECGRNVDNPLL